MALGTASVTIAVAIGATLFRTTAIQGISGKFTAQIVPALEITAGLIVTAISVQLLLAVT